MPNEATPGLVAKGKRQQLAITFNELEAALLEDRYNHSAASKLLSLPVWCKRTLLGEDLD